LPGWYYDWVLLERDRLRQLRMHAPEALADKYAGAGRYGEAAQAAFAAVRAEPLRESAHLTVIRIHLAEGNVAEAVRENESFRALLATEMGVAPTPLMLELMGSFLRCHRRLGVSPLRPSGRGTGYSMDGCGRRADHGPLGSWPDPGERPRSSRSSATSASSNPEKTTTRTST
jgi:hypothetical protein